MLIRSNFAFRLLFQVIVPSGLVVDHYMLVIYLNKL
nr:MAG TPA: hypothetical protein [Bacteriophage sp.]